MQHALTPHPMAQLAAHDDRKDDGVSFLDPFSAGGIPGVWCTTDECQVGTVSNERDGRYEGHLFLSCGITDSFAAAVLHRIHRKSSGNGG